MVAKETEPREGEVTVCSELGEPELGWVSGSGCEEVGWVVEVVPEFEGLWEIVDSELELSGWDVEAVSGFSWLVCFSHTVGELELKEEVRGLEVKLSVSEAVEVAVETEELVSETFSRSSRASNRSGGGGGGSGG